jgi:hypothetical protein
MGRPWPESAHGPPHHRITWAFCTSDSCPGPMRGMLSDAGAEKHVIAGALRIEHGQAASSRVADVTVATFPEMQRQRRRHRIQTSKATRDHATMKPAHSILDDAFHYVPAVATSVAETWRRFGWEPTTEEKRKRPRRPAAALVQSLPAVTPIRRVATPAHERDRTRQQDSSR